MLLAMGVPIDLAVGSLRLGIWPTLTEAQVDYVVSVLPEAVRECRAAASLVRP